jgi:hypothetical protein
VVFLAAPAELAVLADVHHRLDAGAVADLPVLDVCAQLHDYPGPFMPGGANAELRHWWRSQVVQHEVNIAVAYTRAVEFEQHIVGACQLPG